MLSKPTLFFVVGPTASGKTRMAVNFARRWGGEVINADAYQVYDALPVLSARPDEVEMAGVPHHHFGVLDPREMCDAHRLAKMAWEKIRDLQERGLRPIVVGGSGLYVKAITHGLAAPPSEPDLRSQLAMLTPEQRVQRLHEIDPEGAAATDLRNDRYVTRNLEICLLTGKPLAEVKASWNRPPEEPFEGVFLDWPREELYARINSRTEAMFEAGVVEEVAAAELAKYSETALKILGLTEIRAYLAGERTREEAVAGIQQATRRYAKRQCTWFRKEKGFRVVSMPEGATE